MQYDFISIVSWLTNNAQSIFNGGANEEEIQNFRAKFPMLDEQLLELYRIHNGQPEEGVFINGMRFFSIQDVIAFHDERTGVWRDDPVLQKNLNHENDHIDMQISPLYWSPKWIPIFGTNEMQSVCLDYAPSEKGVAGQLIDTDVMGLDLYYIKPNLSKYFKCILSKLTSGDFEREGGDIYVACDDSKVKKEK